MRSKSSGASKILATPKVLETGSIHSSNDLEVEFHEVRASKQSRFLMERAQEGFSHKNSLGQRVVETHLPALHNKVGQLPEIALS
jgi:hypothetical protein